jgi:hypothetical protein
VTPDQFSALAQLLRLRTGPAQVATRMVMVDGAAVADAAREVAMDYRAAHQAVKRAKQGLQLAHAAAGKSPPDLEKAT